MGAARRRGTYAERKAQAIAAGRVRVAPVSKAMPTARELWALLLAVGAPAKRTKPTPANGEAA